MPLRNFDVRTNGFVTIGGALLTNVVAIAASGSEAGRHSLALKRDGTVVAWGLNDRGQTERSVLSIDKDQRLNL